MMGVSIGEDRMEFLRMEGIFKNVWDWIDFGESGCQKVSRQ